MLLFCRSLCFCLQSVTLQVRHFFLVHHFILFFNNLFTILWLGLGTDENMFGFSFSALPVISMDVRVEHTDVNNVIPAEYYNPEILHFVEGKVFQTELDAKQAYNIHAYRKGFGIRVKKHVYHADGSVASVEFACSCQVCYTLLSVNFGNFSHPEYCLCL